MQDIRAVIFDVDGTLLDTPATVLAAYEHVARTYGLIVPSQAQIMRHMGKSLHDIYEGLFPGADIPALIAANDEFLLDNLPKIRGFQGLKPMLDNLQLAGYDLAIVTGGNHTVLELLERNAVKHYFSSIVHSEHLTHQKPHPEGILLTLKNIGVAPEQAVMVGDMRHDMLAGHSAGLRYAIGLTHGFGTRAELEKAGADFIADNLPEVTDILTLSEAAAKRIVHV